MNRTFVISALIALICLDSGCVSGKTHSAARGNAIIIEQQPDYPVQGRGSRFPGGLVVALWGDGRIVRAVSRSTVGSRYVEGVVGLSEREEFFRFLGSAVHHARRPDGIPIHAAAQVIAVLSESGRVEWARVLPDERSIWSEVEGRLWQMPVMEEHDVSNSLVEEIR